ncbi:MAG: hypothetical protein Q4A32_09415 [Lachnospiraceae bacterium]|nr:hypothetical protein [Lachnospiraceae bacterium]
MAGNNNNSHQESGLRQFFIAFFIGAGAVVIGAVIFLVIRIRLTGGTRQDVVTIDSRPEAVANIETADIDQVHYDEIEAVPYLENLIDANGNVDVTQVPHLYIYPLLNDNRGFDASYSSEGRVAVTNSNNLTPKEFGELLERLYDAGFMLVRMRDLVYTEETPDNGLRIMPRTDFSLPEGKKPLILTEDNANYHHTTEGIGFASKIVLQNGSLKCLYKNAEGAEKVGNYDAVPILEDFLKGHPDFSYNGARMTLALTGYNGVFGYRTDVSYQTGIGLTDLQEKWLAANPEFDYDAEVESAKEVAQVLLDAGYEFANKTWGDRIVGTSKLADLKVDLEKWKTSVEPIIGKTDIFVFSHDSDISDTPGDYQSNNDKYNYFTSEGYHYFCTGSRGVFAKEYYGIDYMCSARYGLTPYNLIIYNQDGNTAGIFNALGIGNFGPMLDSRRPEGYMYAS